MDSEPFTAPGTWMKMTGRFVDHGIRILAAVVLLAVMSSPIRPTGASRAARSPNDLPRTLVIFTDGYGVESAMPARPSLREAVSLPSDVEDELDADIEDELTVKSPTTTASFGVLPSPCPEPHSERVHIAVAIPARPLRC